MSSAGGKKEAAKRRPGRPSKRAKPPALPYRGRLEAPEDPDRCLEFAFDRPMVFKKVFTYFKGINANSLYFVCAPDGVTIVTRDHFKKARIIATVPAAAVNSYFCHRIGMLFSVQYRRVADVFNSIDKTFSKISISARHDVPDEVVITFKDHVIEKECVNRVKITVLRELPEDDRNLLELGGLVTPPALEAAPVRFILSSQQFKKTIADAVRRKVAAIAVEKFGRHDLQIIDRDMGESGAESNGYNEVYRKAEAISLRSTVADGERMQCTFYVAVVKSLATAMVANQVEINCYRDGSRKDMVLVSPIVDDAKRTEDEAGPAGMVRIATVVDAYQAEAP